MAKDVVEVNKLHLHVQAALLEGSMNVNVRLDVVDVNNLDYPLGGSQVS